MRERTPLAPDATLRSVVTSLEDPVAFIRHAYAVINRHERESGPVVLRLGVSKTSKGKWPNYRIDHARTSELIVAIDGANHKPWPEGEADPDGSWSTASMTYAEVRTLLAEIREREFKGKKPEGPGLRGRTLNPQAEPAIKQQP